MGPILKDMYPAAIDPLALNRRPTQPSKRWVRVVYVIACSIALLMALYLTAMKLTGHITDLAGCGGEGGCASILGGRWANWLRVPISLWAVGVYVPLLLLGVLGFTTPIRRRLALIGTSVLVAAAVWFLFIQAIVERQFCPYCLVLHVCGLLAFACVVGQTWSTDLSERATSLLSAGGVASLVMLALVLGQFFGPQPDTHQITLDDHLAEPAAGLTEPAAGLTEIEGQAVAEGDTHSDERTSSGEPTTARRQDLVDEQVSGETTQNLDITSVAQETAPASESATTAAQGADVTREQTTGDTSRGRMISYFDGAISLPVDELPLIGRPDARHILLKYFDYTCPSCRRMHDDLAVAMAAYPDDLAVILIPCPLNHACNPHADEATSRARGPGSHEFACELARLALAMWRVAPQKFEQFHNELFARHGRMTPAAAILVGDAMIQQTRLEAASKDVWIDALLKHSTGIYGRMKQNNPRMPKLLLGGRKVLHGITVSTDELVKVLREQLQLGDPVGSLSPTQ